MLISNMLRYLPSLLFFHSMLIKGILIVIKGV